MRSGGDLNASRGVFVEMTNSQYSGKSVTIVAPIAMA